MPEINTQAKPPEMEHKDTQIQKPDAYILGGGDLEMALIHKRLSAVGAHILGGVTTWENADIDKRSGEITQVQEQGMQPVLIEHRGADDVAGVEHIDHHGENTHREAAILQVLSRLGLEPNFIDKIVAANDSGYIPGMKAMLDGGYRDRFIEKRIAFGDTPDVAESRYDKVAFRIMTSVRREDRKAQGVTPEMEQEAHDAIEQMEDRDGLKIVSISGDRTSVITDLLALEDIKNKTTERTEENLIVVCAADRAEKELWFFGPGDVCKEAADHFAQLKEQRIAADPNEPPRRGIYHTVRGGAGFGHADQIARCLVVADEAEEVINFIHQKEQERITKEHHD